MAEPKPHTEALVVVKKDPFNAEAPLSALTERLTPTEHFYVRNNFAVPQFKPGAWRLDVDGAVERQVTLALNDLRAMPARTLTTTMECAGNGRTSSAPLPAGEPWSLGAVSTGLWRGVALRDILQLAGPRSSVVEILFAGADGGVREGVEREITFSRSLPIPKALHADTLLAYELNGAPLPDVHGGPVRLLVPGWYGMASVKWVVRITALEEPFTGYFQSARYVLEVPGNDAKEPVRDMRVRALITNPKAGDVLKPGRYVISGVAWGGAGEITAVEVSMEGGGPWQPATLVSDAVPYTWRQWEFACNLPRAGRYVVRARATDAAGNAQPDVAQWNRLGYENNSIQPVIFEIRD